MTYLRGVPRSKGVGGVGLEQPLISNKTTSDHQRPSGVLKMQENLQAVGYTPEPY